MRKLEISIVESFCTPPLRKWFGFLSHQSSIFPDVVPAPTTVRCSVKCTQLSINESSCICPLFLSTRHKTPSAVDASTPALLLPWPVSCSFLLRLGWNWHLLAILRLPPACPRLPEPFRLIHQPSNDTTPSSTTLPSSSFLARLPVLRQPRQKPCALSRCPSRPTRWGSL